MRTRNTNGQGQDRTNILAPSRRGFLKGSAALGAAYWFGPNLMVGGRAIAAPIAGGTLDPTLVPKFMAPLVKPPAFRRDGKIKRTGGKNSDYYEIAMRQFQQQILPAGTAPMTTVWSYGPANATTVDLANGFFYPAFTMENKWRKPAVVKWVNGLVDDMGVPLPHLLPVDQTLHWANPPGPRDMRGTSQESYTGPVPMVTHVHGAHTTEESDGYPEAWYLPAGAAANHNTGTYFDLFDPGDGSFGDGFATFTYPNDQRATTLWYHDHTLGMTRVNVYAGPAGFWLIRGGPDDAVLDSRDGTPAILPGPAPDTFIDPFGTYYEIPIGIQDRSFDADGGLFYPDNRAFFEGLDPDQLQIPFIPDVACDGLQSDVPPIWLPEFFGNMMVVNGQTWPFLDVEQRRYRLRLLNGCNSRFLILQFNDPSVQVWQIGAEGGFLPAPVDVNAVAGGQILMAPAERADIIVDFTNVPAGTPVTLLNLGPDEPFGGGVPGVDFDSADPDSTGQVMEFRVTPAASIDTSTPPQFLQFPAVPAIDPLAPVRAVSLNEEESKTVRVVEDADGNIVLACDNPSAEAFGPTAALLGTLNPDNTGKPLLWNDPITEDPLLGSTETWEIQNFTADAHPIHIHLVQFQVVGREAFGGGLSVAGSNAPLPTETGYKDTVISYPGETTRVQARFDIAGRYVWHCHIVEHEDNEMMRPYDVV